MTQSALARTWRSYHLFYHGELNDLLRLLVGPLIHEARTDLSLGRWYFIRYHLGGPHVRLRWEFATEGQRKASDALLRNRAGAFFERFGSEARLSDAEILKTNVGIAETDPAAASMLGFVGQNNSVEEFPPAFEIERYGGPACFDHSLDLFACQSEQLVSLLADQPSLSFNQRVPAYFAWAIQLACGLARPDTDFLTIAEARLQNLHPAFSGCVRRAEETFHKQAELIVGIAQRELDLVNSSQRGALYLCALAAARCAQELCRETYLGAASSHVHMAANRLGMQNAEEIYLLKLLCLSLQRLPRLVAG